MSVRTRSCCQSGRVTVTSTSSLHGIDVALASTSINLISQSKNVLDTDVESTIDHNRRACRHVHKLLFAVAQIKESVAIW